MEIERGELIRIKRSFNALQAYVAKRQYKGYDPYDVLLSPLPFGKLGKWPPILAIQIAKRNPMNFRKVLGVPRMWNPKALGLFLAGYSQMPKSPENEAASRWLFAKLLELQTPDMPGMCWGYPFPWASPAKFLPAWSPTSVVSGFVAQGIDAYYRQYGDPAALKALEAICVFMSEALPHTQRDPDFYAISYSTISPDFCYNASLLAGQTYAMTFAHTGTAAYAAIARKTLDTVIKRQKGDGSWNYSEDLNTGKQRVQIDFHQGFILDSILSIGEHIDYFPDSVEKALQEGFEFYRDHQFTRDGRALWRLPGDFPADIHHQAQGVLTALRYYRYSKSRRAEAMAKLVLDYTLKHFQNKSGGFYYRQHRHFTDRTVYMRWANAWMFLALSEFLGGIENDKNLTAV